MDLFGQAHDDNAPLAYRMRPRRLDDYVGQQALVGPGKPLRRMAESGIVRSMILWGPPGTGKTTLAEILAEHSGA
ncbi:MAG: AAA family ATPase, partial [Halomonas sp.]|nr:AAA family ATPase [Halomonas sp.]MDX5502802.1 AAA family ATPase [Halomonas sp.]